MTWNTIQSLSVFDASVSLTFSTNKDSQRCYYEKEDDKQSTRHQRKVRFAADVECTEIPHVNEFSDDEIEAAWYSHKDYRFFRSICQVTIEMIENDEYIDDEEICSRGLECRTDDAVAERRRIRQAVRGAVFQEQDLQDAEGIVDPELIAEVARDASYPSRKYARMVGMYDERKSRRDGHRRVSLTL